MKQNLIRMRLLAAAAVVSALTFITHAFPASTYATQSVLANGKWVRINVDHDGVYQLTASELEQMGFTNIDRVKIYGHGGHMISEVLDGSAIDDLKEQPTMLVGNKLCFYAKGPVQFDMQTDTGTPYFTRIQHGYSTTGSYFLTEGDNPRRVTQRTWISGQNCSNYTSSYNWQLHEEELLTLSYCGRNLLGEDYLLNTLKVPYSLTNLSSTELTVLTTLTVQLFAPEKATDKAEVLVEVLSGDAVLPLAYDYTTNNQLSSTSQLTHYSSASPVATVELPAINPTGYIKLNKPTYQNPKSRLEAAHLDYTLLTFQHTNTLEGETDNQTRIVLPNALLGDTITMSGNASDVEVWNIDMGYPVQMAKNTDNGVTRFSVASTANGSQHIAFDPTKELSHITAYEPVANQNIHGEPVPDMIIVTRAEFMEQAERLAEFHRKHDHAEVLVVEEQQVFNEFSSGTRDAMGVRLMCKMFYDREVRKFRHLLLMGQGTYDNRHILTNKPGSIITFEAAPSHSEASGYAADDFFGILDDGSGARLSSDLVRLGVGRITSATVEEAKGDVDKVIAYVGNADYGPWRNNGFISADEGNEDMHIHQAQGICDIIATDAGVVMNQSKDFIPMFPKSTNEDYITALTDRSCPESNRYMANALIQGQYFATYVGHAAKTCFTARSKMWTNHDAQTTSYEHWPIMTTACCDVARFDANTRGIAEHMFHKTDGGCIAALVATREVLANGNDQLNRAFTTQMFTLNSDGTMPTLGQVTMRAKQSLRDNDNKMNFMLLGDPMIAVNYPRRLVEVTKVNGVKIEDNNTVVNTSPMHQLNIEAKVLTRDKKNIDASFNGDVTINLYDAKRLLRYVNYRSSVTQTFVTRRIDYPRTLITQVDGKVTNGIIQASVILPRNIEASDTTVLLSIYAHKTGTDEMVNGTFENINIIPFNEATAVVDTQAPVITSMYLGDSEESFEQNKSFGRHTMLHIQATDETAICGLTDAVAGSMKLLLDGNNSYIMAKNTALTSADGKQLDVQFPLNDLTTGRHELTFTVYDMAGNKCDKTIEFTIDQTTSLTLEAENSFASEQTVFDITETTLSQIPEVTIKVTDALGNLVWTKTTSSFPCVWNLKGNDGQRVANGSYRYWCTYDTPDYYGGSPMRNLIVIEQ